MVAAALAATGGRTWRQHRAVERVQSALPPLPSLDGKPTELTQKILAAEAKGRSRDDALAGVIELGRLYHANGFTREAEACWRLLQAEQPREARWAYYLANLRRLASDYPEMTAELERTVKLAPDYAPAWLQLAELQFKTGHLDVAAGYYQQRLALLPSDPYARLGLARIASQSGRRDEARQLLEQLLKDNPKFSTGHNLYAEILAATGNETEANRHRLIGRESGRFREADDPWLEELQPWCYDYGQLCNYGTIEYQTSHGDRGKALFERAIKLRPNEPTAYEQLGILYLQLNDAAKAREVLETGLARARDSKPSILFYVNLSRAYRALKLSAESIGIIRRGLAEAGDQFELYDALGVALGDAGNYEEAVTAFHRAIAINPNDPNANYNLSQALLVLHRLDEALAAIRRCLFLQPTYPRALLMLGKAEMDSGRWESAEQYVRPLYDSHPEMVEARQLMIRWQTEAGQAAETNRDAAGAERHYREGLAVDNNNADLQVRLGVLYLTQSRFPDAVGPLEKYRQLLPENPQASLFLGQAYAATGRPDDAKRILAEGVRLAEKQGNATTARHCREILEQL
jgi:HemY protein